MRTFWRVSSRARAPCQAATTRGGLGTCVREVCLLARALLALAGRRAAVTRDGFATRVREQEHLGELQKARHSGQPDQNRVMNQCRYVDGVLCVVGSPIGGGLVPDAEGVDLGILEDAS